MASQPLTPSQALWQHYNIAPVDKAPSLVQHNPVAQKELYVRLQKMGRDMSRTASMGHLAKRLAASTNSNWHDVSQREDEGLGLSEM